MVQEINDWSDFNLSLGPAPVLSLTANSTQWFIDEYLKKQTIPILRQFGDAIQAATGAWLGLRSSERKAELLVKIQDGFRAMRSSSNFTMYQRVRYQCEAIGVSVARPYHAPAPTFGGVHHTANGYNAGRYPPASSSTGAYRLYPPAGPSRAGSSGWGRADTSGNLLNRPNPSATPILQDWKENPFWKPIKALTNLEALPDIPAHESSHRRLEKKVHFTLPTDVVDKMSQTKSSPSSVPQYSIRLFCTSSDYYKPPNTPWQQSQAHIDNQRLPIEYPSAPDVHVDEYPISFKERGLRGKAGSAPPFDLNRSTRGIVLMPGRLMNVAFGHSGPTTGKKKDQAKRFFFQIVFVEWIPKEELLNRLLRKAPTDPRGSPEASKKDVEDDDDIVIGSSNMSLKDPLSYMRITRPVRSKKCSHKQCFDATWWVESNAVHPQWLCPLCNRELHFDDLIVDGFFLEILHIVPDVYDEILMEASGEWHTQDNKYGSPSWLATHGSSAATPAPTATAPSPDETRVPDIKDESPDTKGKRKAIEILSSDEENEVPRSRTNSSLPAHPIGPITLRIPSASSANPSSTRQSAQPTSDVIDLTFSSDEEDDNEADAGIPGFQRLGARYTSRGVDDSIPPLPSLARLVAGDPATRWDGGAWDWNGSPSANGDPHGIGIGIGGDANCGMTNGGDVAYRDGLNGYGKRPRENSGSDKDVRTPEKNWW